MSRPIRNLEHAWRAIALVFAVLIAGEAWYIHLLSAQINTAREAQSKALEVHLSDQYVIGTLKRAARESPPATD